MAGEMDADGSKVHKGGGNTAGLAPGGKGTRAGGGHSLANLGTKKTQKKKKKHRSKNPGSLVLIKGKWKLW